MQTSMSTNYEFYLNHLNIHMVETVITDVVLVNSETIIIIKLRVLVGYNLFIRKDSKS